MFDSVWFCQFNAIDHSGTQFKRVAFYFQHPFPPSSYNWVCTISVQTRRVLSFIAYRGTLSIFTNTLDTYPRGEVGLLPSFTQEGRFQRGIRLRRSYHQSSLVSVLRSHRPFGHAATSHRNFRRKVSASLCRAAAEAHLRSPTCFGN